MEGRTMRHPLEHQVDAKTPIIVLGGTSHGGKTTVAKKVSSEFNLGLISTDTLAKHPGRPWRNKPDRLPNHVVEHYSTLTREKLLAEVIKHYENQSINIETAVNLSLDTGRGILIEGSAILPEFTRQLRLNICFATWLLFDDENVLRDRIYTSSQYYDRDPFERQLIERFVQRSIDFNAFIQTEVEKRKLSYVKVDHFLNPEVLSKEISSVLNKEKGGYNTG